MNFQEFINCIQTGQTEACIKGMVPSFVRRIYNPEKEWCPIHYASGHGQLDIVKALIKNGCHFNALTKEKCHALHLAARYGHVDVVKFLISKGCDIERKNNEFVKPIHLACGYGNDDVVNVLLDSGCSIESRTRKMWTPLHFAASFGHHSIVQTLLEKGANAAVYTHDGSTPLELAKMSKHHKTINILKKSKYKQPSRCFMDIDYNYDDLSARTDSVTDLLSTQSDTDHECSSIFSAIEDRDLDKFMTIYNPNVLSLLDPKSGLSVLNLLIQDSFNEMIDIVLDHDIDANTMINTTLYNELGDRIIDQYQLYRAIRTRDEGRWFQYAKMSTINDAFMMTRESFLEIAAKYGGRIYTKMVIEMLLEKNETWSKAQAAALNLGNRDVAAFIEEREKYLESRESLCWNRLHVAVSDNRNDVIEYILSNSLINASLVDDTLNTPLNMAMILGHTECATTLLRYKPDLNGSNKFGQTALHLAVDSSMDELVDDILAGQTDLSRKDLLNLSPLTSAILHGHEDMCTKIIAKQKVSLTDYIKFDKSTLDILAQIHDKAVENLTSKENYYTLCMKIHGELFDSLKSSLDKAHMNLRDEHDNTLLHVSTEMLDLDLSATIIKVCGERMVHLVNKDGYTPLHLFLRQCVEVGDNIDQNVIERFVNLFLDYKADVLSNNLPGESIMLTCLKLGDDMVFRRLYSDTSNIFISQSEFLEIIKKKLFSILDKLILNFKAGNMNLCFDETILGTITENCSQETIKIILSNTTDKLLNSVREELLIIAAKRHFKDIFELLLKQYIVTVKQMKNGETLMTSLLQDEKYEYCKLLLSMERGIGTTPDIDILVDQKNHKGQSALHIAANCNNMQLLELMMVESVRWNDADNDGNTVLCILLECVGKLTEANEIKDTEKIIKLIIRAGQDIYRLGKDGNPIIHICQNIDIRTKLERFQKVVRPDSIGIESKKNVSGFC